MFWSASELAESCDPPNIRTGTRLGEFSLADKRATFAATKVAHVRQCYDDNFDRPQRVSCVFGCAQQSGC